MFQSNGFSLSLCLALRSKSCSMIHAGKMSNAVLAFTSDILDDSILVAYEKYAGHTALSLL